MASAIALVAGRTWEMHFRRNSDLTGTVIGFIGVQSSTIKGIVGDLTTSMLVEDEGGVEATPSQCVAR